MESETLPGGSDTEIETKISGAKQAELISNKTYQPRQINLLSLGRMYFLLYPDDSCSLKILTKD